MLYLFKESSRKPVEETAFSVDYKSTSTLLEK